MKRKPTHRLRDAMLLAALSVLAISCAHEPEMSLNDSDASATTQTADGNNAAVAANASEADKKALDSEAQQIVNPDPNAAPQASNDAASASDEDTQGAAMDKIDTSAPATDNAEANTTMEPTTSASSASRTIASESANAGTVATSAVAPSHVTTAAANGNIKSAEKVASTKPRRAVKQMTHPATPSLNRYYFLRTGDTPEYLSKLFYGSPDKADTLVVWNSPRENWQPGKIIYYSSALKPRDRKMHSYYEEKRLTPDTYITKAGDSLAGIAEEKYGSSLSANEIAAVNGLHTDDILPSGKELKLYRSPLSEAAETKPAAAPAAKTSDADTVQKEIDKVEKESAKAQAGEPVAKVQAPAAPQAPVVPEPDKTSLASMEFGSFVRQNPIVIAGLGALLVLLGSYLLTARRRARSRLDF